MITIICGEDFVASRNYLQQVLEDRKKKGYEAQSIQFDELRTLNEGTYSSSLFSDKRIFWMERICARLKKASKQAKDLLKTLHASADVEILLWEEFSARDLPAGITGAVKEFKPAHSIFGLNESFFPGNKRMFVSLLGEVCATDEERFVFIMLGRHVRNLILASGDTGVLKLPGWQLYKLKSQAKKWSLPNLVLVYESLMKIDTTEKTSSSPYSIKESLEILACYFL